MQTNHREIKFTEIPIHNDKYAKSKVQSCNDKINTDFHDSGLCICFSIILIDSCFKMGKNHYSKFLFTVSTF